MPSGGTLSVSVEDSDGPSQSGVVLAIEDTGVGISTDHMPKIFDAFYTTRGSIGTGIGLFIAKQFIESHHGKITCVSSTDPVTHGTRMSIFLPLENPHSTRPGVMAFSERPN
jgi:signal transduction histidine kinase